MNKVFSFFVILLILPVSLAENVDNYNDYSTLDINFLLDSEIALTGSGSLSKLTANVYLVPQESSREDVISLGEVSTPSAQISNNNYLIYTWTEKSPTYDFGYNSRIKTGNIQYKIPEIIFPYSNLGSEYQQYLQSEETIDITPEIVSKTSEIIGNEDNAYLAVHKIAEWTNKNIEYDLNTLTEKASKQSSWVLENRQGVCDELTSLFISMTRSIGIPARFVSGMAYTNAGYYFGNHGWAEVYYPEYGWVPYDVTYGQFGWIDPTHISLQKSADVDSSILYQWQFSGDLKIDSTREIETKAEISNLGNKISSPFDISITPLKDEVYPGSYVPIKVQVSNSYDTYQSDQVIITKSPELTEDNVKFVALKPKEKKDVYWIVKIPDNFNTNFVYTITIETKDQFNTKDSDVITFSANEGYEKISLEEAEDMVASLSQVDEEKYSNQIVLNCNPTKDYFYSFEIPEVNCNVRTFNSEINGLSLCLDSCENFNMPKNSEKEFTFEVTDKKDIKTVTLKNDEIEIKRNILLLLLDKPEIKVAELGISSVVYDTEIKLPITIVSQTPVKNILLKVNSLNSVSIDSLEGSRDLNLEFNSKALSSGVVKIKLNFEDEYGNKYEQEYKKEIVVTDLPWYYEIINIFRNLF